MDKSRFWTTEAFFIVSVILTFFTVLKVISLVFTSWIINKLKKAHFDSVFFSESTNPTFVDEQAIFANNELGMQHIDVYGFDYDYTLASYSTALHFLIYDLAVKELISTYGVRI